MQRVNIGLVCLSWLVLASAVSAQTAVDTSSDAGVASIQNYSGSTLLAGTYFDVRHLTGDGVGYTNSYSQIGAFAPYWINEDSFIAPNVRLIITNSTQIGVNGGLVGRRYVEGLDRIFGIYGYYDNDQNSLNNRYDQFTIGAETIGDWWEMRGNGYMLTRQQNNFVSEVCVGGSPYYSGNQLAFLGTQLRDQAMGGGDFEFGVPVHGNAKWLRAYSGLYAYRTSEQDTFGYRGRVEATVSNDLTLGLIVSQDRLWGTNINATVDFRFSGFQPTRYFPNFTTRERMLNPVQRNWRVATHTYSTNVDVAAINPETNQPYFITHVDNSAASGGDGTYLHPFNYLPDSAKGDIILVHRGTSTEANPVRGSITLADHQRLLGDGIMSTVDLYARYGMCSVQGVFALPGTSNSGLYPFVSNNIGSDRSIVTLANNNEVAGLNLLNGGGSAISNLPSGSRNFLLHNLEISGNKGYGIDLVNASGVGIIREINVGSTNHPNPLGFGQNTLGGIRLSTDSPGLDLAMQNVRMNGSAGGPQAFGVDLIAMKGYLNADLNDVIASGNGRGISITEQSQVVNANLTKVRANENVNTGISVAGAGGIIRMNMNDVGALNNGSNNLQLGSALAPITTSDIIVNATGSNFSGSENGSGVVFSLYAGVGTLNLINSVVTNNKLDGLGVYGQNNAQMLADVQNGNFQSNQRDAFHVEGKTGALINLYVDPTDASNSGRDALFYRLDQNAQLNTRFVNNNLNNSGRSAVHGELLNNSVVNLLFNGNTSRDSGADGFFLNASGNSLANLEIDNGTLANSGRLVGGSSAFNIIADNSAVYLLSDFVAADNITRSGSVGNQAYGVSLNLSNGSAFLGNIYNSNLSDTKLDAVAATVTSGSNATLNLVNTPSLRSGLDGFVANVDYATLTTNFTNSNFNNSARDGMSFNVTNGGILTSNFNNSSFNANGRDGVNGRVTGVNSVASLNFRNGSNVSNNQQSGIEFFVDGGTLNVTGVNAAVSNNGQSVVFGSGILGVVDNSGLATLSYLNSSINNNLDNGVYVATHNGGNVQGLFSLTNINNNGQIVLTPKGNDGIRFELDGSINSLLQVFNGSTVSNNGDDGISIVASNNANFLGTIGTDLSGTSYNNVTTIQNNGFAPPPFSGTRAGVNVTTETNANVGLVINGATIGNTATPGSQQSGLLFTARTGGLLDVSMRTSDLSKNGADAVNGLVTGPGSVANLNLVNVNGNQSGATGALFNVKNGGELNVTTSVNTSFSASGGAGILAQVDGPSVANFDLSLIDLSGNGTSFGGQGFNGLVTNGGMLNTVIDTSSISGNANQGIQLTATDPNSVMNFNVAGTSIDSNGAEGLLMRIQNQAQINYRSLGNSYSGNGFNGGLDGVSVTVTGNGPADSAKGLLLFSGDQVNGNAGNGFTLNASNGATLTTSMENGVSASDNAGYGIATSATGANTKFNLLMSGTNTFTNNGLGAISPLSFTNIDQAVVVLTGSYDVTGVQATYSGVNNALFGIVGPGTINNSTSDGINVSMTDVTNGSVLIDGVTSINDSAQDGVRITLDNVANGAVNIFGATQISNSGFRGIDVNILNNTTLVSNIGLGLTPIEILTTTDNLATPLNNRLPIPVLTDLNSLGVVADTALIISGQTVSNSGAEGISLNLQNSAIQANSSFLTNNTITSSQGDGVLINAQFSSADGMSISGVTSNNNTGSGINVVGSDSSLQDLTMTGGSTGVNTGLDFTIIGNTFPDPTSPGAFNLINTSGTSTANVTGFHLDTSTSVSGAIFNTVSGAAYPFTPANGTDVTTGLTTVNGTAVPPYPANLVADFSQVLDLTFNNFAPGKNFQWDNDFDLTPGGDESVFGNDLIGSQIQVDFTGGLTLAGSLVALPGDPTASHFVATSGNLGGSDVSNNGVDGIRFSLNNTNLSGLNITGYRAESNANNGIEFTGTGGAVAGSVLNNVTLANNTIRLNAVDGVHLVNPNTVNTTIQMAFNGNTISENNQNGVNLSLVAGQQDLAATFANNTISQNANGAGVNIQLANNHNFTGSFDTNTINTNGTQGINLNPGLNGHITSDFTNNTINGNRAEGINVNLKTGGQFTANNFYGNTIGTSAAPNGGMGVRLTAPDQSSFTFNLGDSTQRANLITGNVDAGVGIDMTGSAQGTLNVHNTTFSNTTNGSDVNFNGDGLAIHMNNTATLNDSTIGTLNATNSIATNDTTFSNNAGNGLAIVAQGNSTMQNLLVTNVNATGNTGDGINIFRIGSANLDNTIIQNSQIRSNANGINLIASNNLKVDDYTILNNQIVSNNGDGLRLDARFDAQILATVTSNLISQNTGDGIHAVETNNAPTDNRLVTGTWSLNTITNNGQNGIEISARNFVNIGASTTQIDNTITGNGQNGILINGVNAFSSTVIQGNNIASNGTNGIVVNATNNAVAINSNLVTSNGGDGIDLFGRNGGQLFASVDNTTIRFNQGDGMKINSSGQLNTGATFNVTVGTNSDNDISDNLGHGITILNQNDGNASINISNNLIDRNGLEGVYVVNTASATQTQNNTIAVNADGDIFDNAQMRFVFSNNEVRDNGYRALGANFSDTTGLYLRVGTNGASLPGVVNDAGGFASNASAVNSVATAGLTGRGGVLALVSDNVFGGNAGHDVAFESFVSTPVAPTGDPANWTDQNENPPDPTNDIFDPTGYVADPLARLDMQFVRNVGEDADVTRSGAAYQSTDPVWKSRIANDLTVASPPGPFFDGGSRQRNAQRLASRAAPFNAPLSPLGASFLYPGVGASTFRVSTDSNTLGFGSADSFNSQVGLGVLFGELPFNWQTNLAP